jgi:hypothetical protein
MKHSPPNNGFLLILIIFYFFYIFNFVNLLKQYKIKRVTTSYKGYLVRKYNLMYFINI